VSGLFFIVRAKVNSASAGSSYLFYSSSETGATWQDWRRIPIVFSGPNGAYNYGGAGLVSVAAIDGVLIVQFLELISPGLGNVSHVLISSDAGATWDDLGVVSAPGAGAVLGRATSTLIATARKSLLSLCSTVIDGGLRVSRIGPISTMTPLQSETV
jgi:hypothetical protein